MITWFNNLHTFMLGGKMDYFADTQTSNNCGL